jgi:hypothetical protein
MKERGQTMARWRLFRTASLIAMMAVAGFGAAGQVTANEPVIQVVGSDATSRFVPLGIGKSVVIELPRDASAPPGPPPARVSAPSRFRPPPRPDAS